MVTHRTESEVGVRRNSRFRGKESDDLSRSDQSEQL
jgi:hypothetical protein